MNGTDAVARAAATWPPIVALPLRDLHDAGEPARLRLWAACDLVEMLARLMVVLGISDLAAVGDRRLPPDLLRELYGLIDEPTLGAWQRMAEAVARRGTWGPARGEFAAFGAQRLRPWRRRGGEAG